jgi:uncharacterized protein
MKFTRERPEGIYSIHAIEPDGVWVNSPRADDGCDADGRLWLTQSFIISPRQLHQPWRPRRMNEITSTDLERITTAELEVLLLGSGREMNFPGVEQLAALVGLGIGYEMMNSAAACRTYNILAGEGRQVAAAILLEPAEQ